MSSDVVARPASRSAELQKAGLKILAALVVGGGLLALYSHEVRVESQVKELVAGAPGAQGARVGGAQAALARDTPAGWLAAEAALDKALELQPSNPYALAALAAVEERLADDGYQGRSARADAALSRAEAKDVSRPERHEAHALALIASGRPVDAENYLRPLVEKYGGYWELYDALGRAQRAAGKLDDAKKSLRRAMEIGWRSPRAVADYATVQLEDGASADAAVAFDRALQANGDHLRSLVGKARALLALSAAGRTIDLKAAYGLVDGVVARPAAELSPALKAQALAARAEVNLAQGDLAAAAKDADDALAAMPGNPAGLRAKALVLAASHERRAEAEGAFKAALDKDPYDASLYFDGAAALAAAGQLPQAEKLLGHYAALLPKTGRYQLALSRVLEAKGDAKGAAAALDTAAKDDPANASIYFEQGKLAQARGDTKAARALYEHAVQLRDDYPEAYRQIGALYLDGGDPDAAVLAYTEAFRRYRAARIPAAQLEPFLTDVENRFAKAGQGKKSAQWLKDARASH